MRVNPRIQLRELRKSARDQRYETMAREGGGEREKARRVSQMLRESLRAENGVVVNYGTLGEAMLAQSDRNEPWYDGTSGQDRESYSDDQDRESYTVEEQP